MNKNNKNVFFSKKICFFIAILICSFISFKLILHFQNDDIAFASVGNSEILLNQEKEPENLYQVLVFGGDPEGISAAISASRMGAKVLLISYEDGLGGLMTYGWLNSIDINNASDKTMVTQGIFKEFYSKIGGDSFDVNNAKKVFEDMVNAEKNITYVSGVTLKNVIVEDNIFKGVVVDIGGYDYTYYANRVIDATQDGDLCAMAGIPYTYGQEDIGLLNETMSATLVFKVKGLDWDSLKKDISNRRENGYTDEGINSNSAWGFGDVAKLYNPINDKMKLRGLNIGRQNDGTVLINALQIIGLNGLDDVQVENALKNGEVEVRNVVEFLRQNIPSFKNVEFVECASELYIRETRHIEGEYVLTVQDVLENRDFDDKIAMGSYPLDVQTTAIDNSGFVIGKPDKYTIPLRCLIPKNVENIFIVGRSASYSSLAASSTRTIPVGMCTGEAAGVVATYSIINSITPRSIISNKRMILDIQNILVKQGVYLEAYNGEIEGSSNFAYEDYMKLVSLRLVLNGYSRKGSNFTETITNQGFIDIVFQYLNRIDGVKYNEMVYPKIVEFKNTDILTVDGIAKLALYLIEGQDVDILEAYDVAKNKKILTNEFWKRTQSGDDVTLDIAYDASIYFFERLGVI